MPFFLGTSFKMNKTRGEVRAWLNHLRTRPPLPAPPTLQLFVVPPFTAIEAARTAARNLPILIGAQTCGPAEAGAFTGEVSAAMLADVGCDLVELGHSERRAMFGETDAAVNAKVKLVLKHGMRPLVCVGESAAERARGEALAIVTAQARAAFAGVAPADLPLCLLAYEPVWAIGVGGRPATPDDAKPVHAALKDAFPVVPVLYGGSVDAGNAGALAVTPGIDGLFVGRAALDPAAFIAILRVTLAARG